MDLTAAPVTPLVLTVLSEGESHGYPILKRLRDLSGGELEWATPWSIPSSMASACATSTFEWRALPDGHRRRYYAITDDGRDAHVRPNLPEQIRTDPLARKGRR